MSERDTLRELEALSLGFRQRYLDYEDLTRQLHAWTRRYPQLAQLQSLGNTPEGRELWLLIIGPDPDQRRPAVWIDGDLHAIEYAGSSVALAIAEDALELHLAPEQGLPEVPPPIRDAARNTLFYVMPRMSPDGVERALTTGHYIRSVPRDARPARGEPYWVGDDIDGDGLALTMRQQNPDGEFVESAEFPGLMLQREIDHPGPYYKIYPEGYIRNFNGRDVPNPRYLSDNAPDLNRNFPHRWAPEHVQPGGGPYPVSEPESQAVVEFTSAHPNIYAWLNLHTVGGVYIRPPGHFPDSEMNRNDLALYRQIAHWAEGITGYPTVTGYDENQARPVPPLHGGVIAYAHHLRGCIALCAEMWDVFAQMGIEPKRPFVDHYSHISADDALRMARWDRAHNHSRILPGWRRAEHPQLGPVEVGGFDPRVGLINPPNEKLPGLCAQQSALWLRVASLAPRIAIDTLRSRALGANLTQVDASIANHGYLATFILQSANELDWNGPLYAALELKGARLVEPSEARRCIGHLDGWGRGRFAEEVALFEPISRGSTSRTTCHWTVEGHGRGIVRVGNSRVGWVNDEISF